MCKDLGNSFYQCNGTCGGTVWGTGIYTADSNIYTAAKHMGYLPGAFTKVMLPGLPGYKGTTLNGANTLDYGNYGSSYVLLKGIVSINANMAQISAQLTTTQQNLVNLIKNLSQKHNIINNQMNQFGANIQKIEKSLESQPKIAHKPDEQITKINTLLQKTDKINKDEENLINIITAQVAEGKNIMEGINALNEKVAKAQIMQEKLLDDVKRNQESLERIMKNIYQKQQYLEQLNNKVSIQIEKLLDLAKKIQQGLISRNQQQDVSSIRQTLISEILKQSEKMNVILSKKELLCTICLDRKRQVVILPCKHAHFCKQCAKTCLNEEKCKFCQGEVNGYLPIIL